MAYPKNGSLLSLYIPNIFNSKTASAKHEKINYLEYAPAILNYFGVKKPAYMLEPSFAI